mmetsp:Transcript_71135/g.141369  ORF Transcript_71135/g.141369 Transcript_71135/m.141369 type:complete len:101 (-) Transcript_71135:41-343(-)
MAACSWASIATFALLIVTYVDVTVTLRSEELKETPMANSKENAASFVALQAEATQHSRVELSVATVSIHPGVVGHVIVLLLSICFCSMGACYKTLTTKDK